MMSFLGMRVQRGKILRRWQVETTERGGRTRGGVNRGNGLFAWVMTAVALHSWRVDGMDVQVK